MIFKIIFISIFSILLLYSFVRPLNSQKKYFSFQEFNIFCWADCLKIAFIYKSERKAFLKLLPFILFQSIFSKKMYFSDKLNINSVNWKQSLSFKRYKAKREEILDAVNW